MSLFQGPFFVVAFGVPTLSANGPWLGYIDAATVMAGHGRVNILTVTSVGGMQSNAARFQDI